MPRRPAWPLLVPLLLCGCGLGDYESKMVEAQKRLARHEEEERLLGPAIVIPTRDDGKGEKEPIVASLHLRLPQGLANSPAKEKGPRSRGAAKLYTYPAASGQFKLAELGVGGKEKEFIGDVLGLYDQASKPKTSQRKVQPPGRKEMTFATTEFESGDLFYLVNLYKADNQQVVVVYCLPKAQKAAAARAVELSLESFALGPQADRMRAARGSPLKVPRK
jgi:hypothetical protein